MYKNDFWRAFGRKNQKNKNFTYASVNCRAHQDNNNFKESQVKMTDFNILGVKKLYVPDTSRSSKVNR